MAKITNIKTWKTQGQVIQLRVEFDNEHRFHGIAMYPEESHSDLAKRLHALAEDIETDHNLKR